MQPPHLVFSANSYGCGCISMVDCDGNCVMLVDDKFMCLIIHLMLP